MSNSAATSLDRAWEQVLERLAGVVSADDLTQLMRPLRPRAITRSMLRLEAPSTVTLHCVTHNYMRALEESVAAVMGPRRVQIELATDDQGELFPLVPRGAARRRMAPHGRLNPRYTFANFVIGASNQFAHAASKAVAAQPGDHYNPLFIYGGVGLGKTHLVSAIGHQMLEQQPEARVAFLSSDAFMNDLITSLRRDRMGEFKDRFRRVDLLILDDVQLIAGRERTQEEFFHTFNALYDGRRQIVLTSDKVPKDIPGLEERLRNRFEWGLIADIQPPDVETRVAIVEKKAEMDGIKLPLDVAMFLGSQPASNVRELEGSLTRVAAYASVHHRAISTELAREALAAVHHGERPRASFDDIVRAVCGHFAVRPGDLRSKRRSKDIVQPRQVAMYLCRRLLHASFPTIGDHFARDHSTVMHAVSVTDKRQKDDPALRATIEHLERTIRQEQQTPTPS